MISCNRVTADDAILIMVISHIEILAMMPETCYPLSSTLCPRSRFCLHVISYNVVLTASTMRSCVCSLSLYKTFSTVQEISIICVLCFHVTYYRYAHIVPIPIFLGPGPWTWILDPEPWTLLSDEQSSVQE